VRVERSRVKESFVMLRKGDKAAKSSLASTAAVTWQCEGGVLETRVDDGGVQVECRKVSNECV
jgi:hypothetical protein